jgi:hypothetical protein
MDLFFNYSTVTPSWVGEVVESGKAVLYLKSPRD